MEIVIKAIQLILALMVLVGIHELGHMLAAKMFGMRVEKFSIGFPPKVFAFIKGGTEYSLGMIPLGGFVKISGMVDESMDVEKLKEAPKPWEFRSKPAWQRLIVMLGGIIFNVILGCAIFSGIIFFKGTSFIPAKEIKHGIVAYELGQKIGLKTGDQIIAINGKSFKEFDDVVGAEVLLDKNSTYTVVRDGAQVIIKIPANFVEMISKPSAAGKFIAPRIPFSVGEVSKGMGGEKAGLLQGDKIDSVNHQPVTYFYQLPDILAQNKNKVVTVSVTRNGEKLILKPHVDKDGRIGFKPNLDAKIETVHYGVGESVVSGTTMAFSIVTDNIKGLGKMFRGEIDPRNSISGIFGIGNLFPANWDWDIFWRLTGVLSMALAFMNLLPIPALDGGHVVFLTYEMITGRKPSDKFLENSQKIGMALLLSIMVFSIFNDISKWEIVEKLFK